jgi:hypothetical protein
VASVTTKETEATGKSEAARLGAALGKIAGKRRRRGFEGMWFSVRSELFDSGLAAQLRPTWIVRYLTLLRLSNFEFGARVITASLSELAKLDGVSPRAAFECDRHLYQDGFNLLRIQNLNAGGRRVYQLVDPKDWKVSGLLRPEILATNPLKLKAGDQAQSQPEKEIPVEREQIFSQSSDFEGFEKLTAANSATGGVDENDG